METQDFEAQYAETLGRLREHPDDASLEARVCRLEADLALESAQNRLTAARSDGNPLAISLAVEAFDEAEMAYLLALEIEAKSTSEAPPTVTGTGARVTPMWQASDTTGFPDSNPRIRHLIRNLKGERR